MSNTHLDRATILTEALPYIQRYNGKIVVVNCGGVAMNQELRDAVATDITLLRLVGVKVVLVHGIGPEVRQALKDAGKELPVVDGFPQVNENAIDLVQETLCGKVNKTLAATLNKLGAKAIGLCGIDGGFLTAKSAGGTTPAPASWSRWTAASWRTSCPRATLPWWPPSPRGPRTPPRCTASAPTTPPPSWRWP